MAEDPLGEALQEQAQEAEEQPRANTKRGIRRPLPDEAESHLEPAQPNYGKKDQSRQSQFSSRERGEAVGGSGLGLIHVARRRHVAAGIFICATVRNKPIAEFWAIPLA